jgi:hypothetical protein
MTDDLFEYLTEFSFPFPGTESEEQLEKDWQRVDDSCFEFLQKLGYDPDNISRHVELVVDDDSLTVHEKNISVSCVIRNEADATPYIVADAYVGSDTEIDPDYGPLYSSNWATTYWKYFDAVDASFFVVFSNEFLTIAKTGSDKMSVYPYDELTKSEVRTIQETLSHPASDQD